MTKYKEEELNKHWISTADDTPCGVALFLEPTSVFSSTIEEGGEDESHSLQFLVNYVTKYKHQFIIVFLCLVVASGLQLLLPFLTQSIVDVGIKNQDIEFVWLVLIGQLMLTVSRTVVDFVRRRLLLKISLKVNIAMLSDFFKKLLRLPMSFFDTKLMGDIMQRMGDHGRLNSFLTQNMLNTIFALITFVVFGCVLWWYNTYKYTRSY